MSTPTLHATIDGITIAVDGITSYSVDENGERTARPIINQLPITAIPMSAFEVTA
ncbi:hypothetical protein L5I01_17320 [Gordonia sp. HY442]|uniref:hypothetical protein n=1 Tax=Gordonia zhenghanii TaxID=2911516 RepID=UPI001F3D2B34|nr:hypothetical protein [Gordonia zhenghanii]MCF8605117.1 hypothetical protein [Gordonia zhenghanii]